MKSEDILLRVAPPVLLLEVIFISWYLRVDVLYTQEDMCYILGLYK